MNTRTKLACGLALPFYPMRPFRGQVATETTLKDDLASGRWVLQPKLDGDRAMLGVVEGGTVIANRHMGLYQFAVKNAVLFTDLPVGTCLDGEVWKGNFYPFETLGLGTTLMTAEPVEIRIAEAKHICEIIGVDWLFEAPTKGWVKANRNVPRLEGYVKKRRGSRYEIIGVERESLDWCKVKWR